MRKLLKQMKWDVILTSLLYVVLGVTILIIPNIMFRTLGYLIGAFLIVAGAVSMIGYLLRDAHQNYYRNDFVYGLVEITIGIIVLYKIENIMELVPVILGILVVASGCRKLQDVIDMKRMEYGNWIAMLVLAAANVIFGVVLILDPIEAQLVLERLIGAGLIVSGATDCIVACYFAGKIKKYLERLEAVDGTYVEVTSVDEKADKRRKADKEDGQASAGAQDKAAQQAGPQAGKALAGAEASPAEAPLAGAEASHAGAEASAADVQDNRDKEGAAGKGDGKDGVAGSKVIGEDKGEEQ